jgi:hypothetical protein
MYVYVYRNIYIHICKYISIHINIRQSLLTRQKGTKYRRLRTFTRRQVRTRDRVSLDLNPLVLPALLPRSSFFFAHIYFFHG